MSLLHSSLLPPLSLLAPGAGEAVVAVNELPTDGTPQIKCLSLASADGGPVLASILRTRMAFRQESGYAGVCLARVSV